MNVIHRTTTPVDYRVSVHTPDFPIADWSHTPDLSAVTGQPQKYWKPPGVTEIVTLMDAGEQAAVDAAEAAAIVTAGRDGAIDELTNVGEFEGWELRELIELFNKRDNYILNRVILALNVMAAGMDSTGAVQNLRDAMIAQAALTFPQELTAAAAVHFPNAVTRTRAEAITDYTDDINAGGADS